MTHNTSHNVWQYAFDHNPILDHSDYDLACPARLADSVETYLITVNGEVYVRLAMGASKLLAYYCDDNNSGSLAMAGQFADYRQSFNGWIKNVALHAPMGHAVFNHGYDEIADNYASDPWFHPTYDDMEDCGEY